MEYRIRDSSLFSHSKKQFPLPRAAQPHAQGKGIKGMG